MGPWKEIIDQWLTDDLTAPRKQRHTGRRVWERLVDEHQATAFERAVRKHVKEAIARLGDSLKDANAADAQTTGSRELDLAASLPPELSAEGAASTFTPIPTSDNERWTVPAPNRLATVRGHRGGKTRPLTRSPR